MLPPFSHPLPYYWTSQNSLGSAFMAHRNVFVSPSYLAS